jgi:hypothetical protein
VVKTVRLYFFERETNKRLFFTHLREPLWLKGSMPLILCHLVIFVANGSMAGLDFGIQSNTI